MQEQHPTSNPYFPDVALFLILIPFISAVNYYLTYSGVTLSWFLLLTFSIDTAEGYLAWWAVRTFIIFLDKKMPYEKGFLPRIIIQLIATIVIGLLIIGLLTELVSLIAKGQPAPLSFYTVDLVIISIWFFVINGIYSGLHYYNLWKNSEEKRLEESRAKSEGLLVRHGKQDIRLDFEDVAGFYVDGDYAVACSITGKKYYMGQSLDKLEKSLPVSFFFRLNRQFILHRQAISGFTRAENGKLMVMSSKTDCFPSEILISRIKAPAFKAWFRPDA